MIKRVRVGIWANAYAAPTIGSNGSPVAKAQIRFDFPTQRTVNLYTIIE